MSKKAVFYHLIHSLVVIAILLITVWPVHAQHESMYKRGTPPQYAVGVSPLGSYTSPDLGVVDLVNGGLNFKLPMGQVGGRGFSFPIILKYVSKAWSVRKDVDVSLFDGQEHPIVFATYSGTYPEPIINGSIGLAAGWTVSVAPILMVNGMGIRRCWRRSLIPPYDDYSCGYRYALTKLTLSMPNGSEIQLRDDQTDGAPLGAQFVPGTNDYFAIDGYRGRRWHATDGSGAVFISDHDNAVARGHLAGVFITADGARYRFEHSGTPNPNATVDSIGGSARCVSVTDRHGNKITFNYPNNSQIDIVDQLGRVTRLQSNAPDPDSPSTILKLLVTLPGYQGQVRYYKIKTGVMNQNYRSDINPVLPVITGEFDPEGVRFNYPGPHTTLFDQSHGRFQTRIDDFSVVTELILPDRRSLKFKYNEFGEVAEAQMPTGGKVQYDYAYASFLPSGVSTQIEVSVRYFSMNLHKIDRSVVARRTYADGVTLESVWSYDYTSTPGAVEVRATSAGGELLSRQRDYFMGGGRNIFEDRKPGGGEIDGVVDGTGYVAWTKGLRSRTETLDASGAVIYTERYVWSQRAPLDWSAVTDYAAQQQPENDNRIMQTSRILEDGSTATLEYAYDRYNNPIEVKEYDYNQTSTPIRRTVTTYVTTNNVGGQLFDYVGDDSIHLLRLPKESLVYGASGVELARTVYEYDNYSSDGNHAPLLVYGSVVGHDPDFGSNRPARGNVTEIGRWLNINGGSFLYSYPRYDILGNIVSTKDPKGFVSTISFTDDFGDGSNPGSGVGGPNGSTYAFPTLVTSPDPGNGAGPHIARSQYDFSTGLRTGSKDRNNIITQMRYDDPFNRPTLTKTALGTVVETHSANYYAPTTAFGISLTRADVMSVGDQNIVDDAVLRSWTRTDGFGRSIESWARDPQGDVKVRAVYDGLGRVSQTSNHHRNGETPVYTTTTYDLAGRVIAVTMPDGATVSTAYSANKVTVIDQAGTRRRSETDALGRLIRVTEDPDGLNYNTNNSYDALGNLRQVTQGSQTRTFVYNSLSQLISATNPESGTITYAYDTNGNMIEKTDARGVRTTITYDALNRARSKVYAGTTPEGTAAANVTPPVSYYYDDYSALPSGAPRWPGTPSKGRLIGVTYGGGSDGTYFKYEAAGRVVASHQRMGTANYATAYFYNLAGAVTREDRGNPVRRRNVMSYDGAGRLSVIQTGAFSGSGIVLGDLVRDISYTPFGALQSEKYGNGLIHSMGYNNRQQPTEIRLGRPDNLESVFRLGYIYGTAPNVNVQDPEIALAHNNGNVARIKYFTSGTLQYSQTFLYDGVNRLSYAVEHNNGVYNDASRAWYKKLAYDLHGNRGIDVDNTSDNMDAGNNALKLADFSAANNRITRAGHAYDSNGNLIAEPNKTYTYNAENKLVTATVGGVGTIQNFYDGSGRLVRKVAVGVATRYEYGPSGELITEWNDADTGKVVQKEYFYKGGGVIATTKTGTSGEYEYATADHLGSPRAWTSGENGNLTSLKRQDFSPFGQDLGAGIGIRNSSLGYGGDSPRQKFTGKEREPVTGLDNFVARSYSSAQGRFLSPDPFNPLIGGDNEAIALYANDPQNWNKYSYSLNQPFRYIDPNGEVPVFVITAGVGAILGATFKTVELAVKGETILSWESARKIGAAALGGAVDGALAGLTGGMGIVGRNVLGGGVGNMLGGGVERWVNGEEIFDPIEMAGDFSLGFAAGGVGEFGGIANKELGLNINAAGFVRRNVMSIDPLIRGFSSAYNEMTASIEMGFRYAIDASTSKYKSWMNFREGISSGIDYAIGEHLEFGIKFSHERKAAAKNSPLANMLRPGIDINTCGRNGNPDCVRVTPEPPKKTEK